MRGRVPALVLGAVLGLGPAVVLAPPAHADGAVLTPGAGTVFEDDTSVRIEARVEPRSGATELRLVDPTGAARTVASAGTSLSAQTLAHTLDTACPDYPGAPCSGRRPARNGTWTAVLTGGATDSRSFVLRIPPRAAGGVTASATGPREVVVTWERGLEPDLTGYSVVVGDGRVLPGDTDCPSGTCRTAVTFDTDGPRTDTFAVRAERAACPGCDSVLTTTSAAVSAQRPAAAPPPPASAPSGGGTGSGGSAGADPDTEAGGSGTGGTGAGTGSGGGGAGAGGATGAGGTGTGTGGGGTGATGTGGTGTGGTGGSAGSGSGGTGTGGTGAGASSPGPSAAGPPGAPATGSPGTAPTVPVTQASPSGDAFALTFRAFGPKIGLPKLPPLPATGVALPDVAPAEDGTFDPALPFDEQVRVEREPVVASGPAQRVKGAVTSAVDSERLVRSVAGALVLLLVCAHLRRWMAQGPSEL